MFHQNKLRLDFQFQITHIVLLKKPRDLMQVSTPCAQSGLRSEQVGWYQQATSVPFCHVIVDLTPRTVDRLSYSTYTGSNISKNYKPAILKN